MPLLLRDGAVITRETSRFTRSAVLPATSWTWFAIMPPPVPVHPSFTAGGASSTPSSAVATPQARTQHVEERHTTPANIKRFFDPCTYRPTTPQKRTASPSTPSSTGAVPKAKLAKTELLEKFKLAAQLNGIAWDELAEPRLSLQQFFPNPTPIITSTNATLLK